MYNDINLIVEHIVKEGVLSDKTFLFDEINLLLTYEQNKESNLNQFNYNNFENLIVDIDKIDKKELDFIAKEIEELEELTENDNRLSVVVNDLKNIQSNLEITNTNKKYKSILEVYEVKKWLYRLLREQGETVLKSKFGYYWGKNTTDELESNKALKQIAKRFLIE